ncbi:hypothetical protein AB2S14_27770, partial [Klebsiella pneumoniae]|uniref:hypothetical protein n=1 Tax=Klebsiella pneumoniae TaxID=573 RepID=UPI003493AC30
AEHFDALVTHVKKRQAFAVRIGPAVVHRIWGTKTIKTAIADDNITSLTEVEPDVVTPEGEHVVSVLSRADGSLTKLIKGLLLVSRSSTFSFRCATKTALRNPRMSSSRA